MIREKFRKIRKAKGVTQRQLAERSGIDRTNISKFERGEHDIRASTLQRLCDALGVSVDFTGKDKMDVK